MTESLERNLEHQRGTFISLSTNRAVEVQVNKKIVAVRST